MCWHKWEYIGKVEAYEWVGGVVNGIAQATIVDAKQCKKCGKRKIIND